MGANEEPCKRRENTQTAHSGPVPILGKIIIDISSWNSSLHAYGISTCEMLVSLSQPLQWYLCWTVSAAQIVWHLLHTCTE